MHSISSAKKRREEIYFLVFSCTCCVISLISVITKLFQYQLIPASDHSFLKTQFLLATKWYSQCKKIHAIYSLHKYPVFSFATQNNLTYKKQLSFIRVVHDWYFYIQCTSCTNTSLGSLLHTLFLWCAQFHSSTDPLIAKLLSVFVKRYSTDNFNE